VARIDPRIEIKSLNLQHEPSESNMENNLIKRTVLDRDDVMEMVPKLRNHPKLVDKALRFIAMDKVNAIHEHNLDKSGASGFVHGLLTDLDIKLRIDGREVLDNLPAGAFITVSNHIFGALDGIMLIDLMASRRPEYKVMVNMVLNRIGGMRHNFIAVDALASDDPAKKAVSMLGIKSAIRQVRSGGPMGFFPAGAVSKLKWNMHIEDREWQPTIIRLISQLKVPVIPVFFHGRNSAWFQILGMIDWRLRTLRLPAEVFNKRGREMHISVGDPIPVDEQLLHQGSMEEFGRFLRERTYSLRSRK